MPMPAQPEAALLVQYEQEWIAHVAQLDQKLQLLQTAKHGMELLLLVGSYLIFYLLDCIAEVMALPLPLVH
jgi:hypothetical protein